MESKNTHEALLLHLSEHLPQTQAAEEEAAVLSEKAEKTGGKKGSKSKDKKDGKGKKGKKNKNKKNAPKAGAAKTSVTTDTLNCEKNTYYDIRQIGEMLALVDAAGSFIHAGNAIQLQDFFASVCDSEPTEAQKTVTEAIDRLAAFSDAVSLCEIEKIGPAAMAVEPALAQIEAVSTENSKADSDLYIEMLKALVADIRAKLHTEAWTGEAAVYPAVIRWAAENRLLQQAVNLYIEKMPVVYMNPESDCFHWIPQAIEFPSTDPVDRFYTDLFIGVRKMDGSVDIVREFRICIKNILSAHTDEMGAAVAPKLIDQEIAAVTQKGREAASQNAQVAYSKLETGLENLKDYVQYELAGKGWKRIYGISQQYPSLQVFFETLSTDSRLSRYFLFDYGAPHEIVRNTDPGTYASKIDSLKTLEKAIKILAKDYPDINSGRIEALKKLLSLMQHYMAIRLTRDLMSQDKKSISPANREKLADQRIAYDYLQGFDIPVDAEVEKIQKIILDGLAITAPSAK